MLCAEKPLGLFAPLDDIFKNPLDGLTIEYKPTVEVLTEVCCTQNNEV